MVYQHNPLVCGYGFRWYCDSGIRCESSFYNHFGFPRHCFPLRAREFVKSIPLKAILEAGCPILARSVRKGGIPQLSNPRDFDRPTPCQTPTAPTSVESHPNVEERDVRMGHPALSTAEGPISRTALKYFELDLFPVRRIFCSYNLEVTTFPIRATEAR